LQLNITMRRVPNEEERRVDDGERRQRVPGM
jgi:hypothetical protein